MTAVARGRIIVLAPSLFGVRPGGIEAVSRFMVRVAAEAAGERPFLLSANEPPALAREAASGAAFGGRHAALLWWAWRRARGPVGEAAGILCLHAGLLPAARILAARLACPYVAFLHGLEVWRGARWQERWGGRHCAGVIANSEHTLQRARAAQAWIGDRPSVVAPLGLLEGEPDRVVSSASRGPLILAVGQVRRGEIKRGRRPRYGKGFDVLFDAFERLRHSETHAQLELITGGDGVPALRADLSARGLKEAVKVRENVPAVELDAAYRRARVFCLPSEQEGFGLVFVEAMARGTPCVCAAAGAAPEVVRDRETGYVLPPRDPAGVAERLGFLIRDAAAWRRMSERALLDVKAKFTPIVVRERQVAALRRLLRFS